MARTNAGIDFQSRVMGDVASTGTGTYAAANYIAVSTDATAPVATDTVLPGELNAASGGLNRAQAAYAHTAGVANYTLTKTFTCNSNDTPPRIINKVGILNAASVGTLVFETLVPSPPTLVVGDQISLTETVSI